MSRLAAAGALTSSSAPAGGVKSIKASAVRRSRRRARRTWRRGAVLGACDPSSALGTCRCRGAWLGGYLQIALNGRRARLAVRADPDRDRVRRAHAPDPSPRACHGLAEIVEYWRRGHCGGNSFFLTLSVSS